jgi:hypothetical protein
MKRTVIIFALSFTLIFYEKRNNEAIIKNVQGPNFLSFHYTLWTDGTLLSRSTQTRYIIQP